MPCSDKCDCYYCNPPESLKLMQRERDALRQELKKRESAQWVENEKDILRREIAQLREALRQCIT